MSLLCSCRAVVLATLLSLGGVASTALAVTPQFASVNMGAFILQSDGSLWSLASGK